MIISLIGTCMYLDSDSMNFKLLSIMLSFHDIFKWNVHIMFYEFYIE